MSNDNTTLGDVLEAVNAGFQAVEDRFQELKSDFSGLRQEVGDLRSETKSGFDRVWNAVGKWPAASRVDELFTRVKYIEHKLDIKPGEALQ